MWKQNAANGYPGLAAAQAATAANGYRGLRASFKVRAANNYASLRKGQANNHEKPNKRDLLFSPRTAAKRQKKRTDKKLYRAGLKNNTDRTVKKKGPKREGKTADQIEALEKDKDRVALRRAKKKAQEVKDKTSWTARQDVACELAEAL